MLRTSTLTLALAAGTILALAPAPSDARPAMCKGPVTGSATAKRGDLFDPPRHYDVEAVARQRAIEAWRKAVAEACPGASTDWQRAGSRKVVCEGVMGGLGCEATAMPARRWWWG